MNPPVAPVMKMLSLEDMFQVGRDGCRRLSLRFVGFSVEVWIYKVWSPPQSYSLGLSTLITHHAIARHRSLCWVKTHRLSSRNSGFRQTLFRWISVSVMESQEWIVGTFVSTVEDDSILKNIKALHENSIAGGLAQWMVNWRHTHDWGEATT